MKRLAEHVSRRKFLTVAGVLVAGGVASMACGGDEGTREATPQLGGTPTGAGPENEVHGVCFMPGEDGRPCKSFYQDLGAVEREGPDVIRLYTFPADMPNPLDVGGNYGPERLQNNLFAADGRFWKMLTVESGGLTLMATTDGSREITSTRKGAGMGVRDLTLEPYVSEEEILRHADAGRIVIVDTGVVVDCPLTSPPPRAVIVDLNPDVGEFCRPA